jgi:hypothetical protein
MCQVASTAAFLLIIVQEDSLLTVLVLEVTSIDVGEGLLVNLWRHATGFFMMIGDLKKQLVPHQSFGASSAPCRKPGDNAPPFGAN